MLDESDETADDAEKSNDAEKPERRRVPRGKALGAVQECFLAFLKTHFSGTTDDVHDRLIIDPADGMQIGKAISDLAQQGLIRRVGYQPSRRRVSHGRVIAVWTLVV